MLRRSARIFLSVALTAVAMTSSAASALAQSQAAGESASTSLKSEVDSLKAENAVVRELLRRMEEQQKALLEQAYGKLKGFVLTK